MNSLDFDHGMAVRRLKQISYLECFSASLKGSVYILDHNGCSCLSENFGSGLISASVAVLKNARFDTLTERETLTF